MFQELRGLQYFISEALASQRHCAWTDDYSSFGVAAEERATQVMHMGWVGYLVGR